MLDSYLDRFLLLSLVLLDGPAGRAWTTSGALRLLRARFFPSLRAQPPQQLAELLRLVLFRLSDSVDGPPAGLDLLAQQRQRLAEEREDVRWSLRVHSALQARGEFVRFEAAVDRFLKAIDNTGTNGGSLWIKLVASDKANIDRI